MPLDWQNQALHSDINQCGCTVKISKSCTGIAHITCFPQTAISIIFASVIACMHWCWWSNMYWTLKYQSVIQVTHQSFADKQQTLASITLSSHSCMSSLHMIVDVSTCVAALVGTWNGCIDNAYLSYHHSIAATSSAAHHTAQQHLDVHPSTGNIK